MSLAYLLNAGEGLNGDTSLKASRASTQGALTLIESDTDGGAPPHVHHREDEAMYVLEGEIKVRVDDQEFRATRGAFVFMPRGEEHAWDVVGDRAVVLILAAPGGLEEFLVEFHSAGDWAGRDEVAARYGLEFPR
jgi:quercetin dioxygenase-like cupin family protein